MAAVEQRKSTPTEAMRSSRSPAPKPKSSTPATKTKDYGSDGVKDNDIFLLPASDFQLLGVLTVVAAVVRLFRIYQPSSVVFDEVQ
jgi:dolichyl-phosphate-mannose-protein mannosyltransferase